MTVYILYHSPAYLVCLKPWLKGSTEAINQKCVGWQQLQKMCFNLKCYPHIKKTAPQRKVHLLKKIVVYWPENILKNYLLLNYTPIIYELLVNNTSVETIMTICICQPYLVNIIFISISFDKTIQLLIINYWIWFFIISCNNYANNMYHPIPRDTVYFYTTLWHMSDSI